MPPHYLGACVPDVPEVIRYGRIDVRIRDHPLYPEGSHSKLPRDLLDRGSLGGHCPHRFTQDPFWGTALVDGHEDIIHDKKTLCSLALS